jgi:hypothetical protein
MWQGQIDDDLRWRVLFRDGFRCVYCGRIGEESPLTVDHAVPYSRGGENTIFNLVTACAPCNVEKSDNPLPAEELERIVLMGREYRPQTVKWGDDVLIRVAKMRSWGAGYKRIARAVGCTRDQARYLAERAERRMAAMDMEPTEVTDDGFVWSFGEAG